jgi:hypothetical protein
VRSWVGWRHHMTLSLAALWFLCLERRHLGGENPGGHRAADPLDRGPAAPRSAPEPGRDRPRGVTRRRGSTTGTRPPEDSPRGGGRGRIRVRRRRVHIGATG